MESRRWTGSGDELLDPNAAAWASVPSDNVGLSGTPLASQPSGYVRARFDPRNVGRVKAVDVRTAHDGQRIYFRLQWHDDRHNVAVTENNQFPDACGVLLPLHGGDPPMQEMGSREAPVNAWFWRADADREAHNVIAEGLGTTRFTPGPTVVAQSRYAEGTWTVVLARELSLPAAAQAETARLAGGTKTKVGFAVWEGGNAERGGVKAYSREWRELAIA